MANKKPSNELEEKKLEPRFKYRWIRRAVQLVCFTLLFGTIWQLGPLPLLVPAEYPLGDPWKMVGSAFDALQKMFFEGALLWLLLASFLLTGVLVGRALCGWMCPFGFVMDIASVFRGKHRQVSRRTHNFLKKMKYLILLLTLFISGTLAITLTTNPIAFNDYKNALGPFAQAPFSVLNPAGTMFALIPLFFVNVLPTLPPLFLMTWEEFTKVANPLFVTRIIILVVVIFVAAYVPRFWCRYLCPQGALMAVIGQFSFLGLRRDLARCTKCRICVDKCPMNVRILDLPWEKFTDTECILCLECHDVCPVDAMRLKAP